MTLIPLLSNASLHSSKFSLNSFIVSPSRTKSSACFIQPYLAFSVNSSITIANNKGDNTDRSLVYTNLQKILLTARSNSNFRFCSFIKTHHCLDRDFRQAFLIAHFITLVWCIQTLIYPWSFATFLLQKKIKK